MDEIMKEKQKDDNQINFELAHIFGINSRIRNCVQAHPFMEETILYSVGGIIICEDLNDKNNQVYFRHSYFNINCFKISNTGRMLAVGFITADLEKKFSSPVIVWDYENKLVQLELTGINKGVSFLEFSPDDRFLLGIIFRFNIFRCWA